MSNQFGQLRVLEPLGGKDLGPTVHVYDPRASADLAAKTLVLPDAPTALAVAVELQRLQGIRHRNLAGFERIVVQGARIWFTRPFYQPAELLTDWCRHDQTPLANERTQLSSSTAPAGRTSPVTGEFAKARRKPRPPSPSYDDWDLVTPLRPIAQGDMDLSRLRRGLRQLADGLQVLHAARTLHGNLKPNNVLHCQDGRLVLVDYGLRPLLDTSGHLGPTDPFRAPEQRQRQTPGIAADWWSAGALLYLILTGQPPAVGPLGLRSAQSVEQLAPAVPPDLANLVMALLDPEPSRRAGLEQVTAWLRAKAGETPHDWEAALPLAETAPATWVGRTEQFRRLDNILGHLRPGEPVLLAVSAAPGHGATSFVQRALAKWRTHGQVYDIVTICPAAAGQPFAPWRTLLQDVIRRLHVGPGLTALRSMSAELLGALGQLCPAILDLPDMPRAMEPEPFTPVRELQRRTVAAMAQLLDAMAVQRPLVLWLEDWQHADGDSAQLLVDLLQERVSGRWLLLMVQTAGQDATERCFGRLRRRHAPVRRDELYLEPLAQTAQLRLLHAWTRVAPGNEPLEFFSMIGLAQGSPWLLQQGASLWQQGRLGPKESITDAQQWLERRATALGADALLVAQRLAVAGLPLPEAGLFLLSRHPTQAPECLVALRAANWIREVDVGGAVGYVPSCSVLRQWLLAGLGDAERKKQHIFIAGILQAVIPENVGAAAWQLWQAGPDPASLPVVTQAAELAMQCRAFLCAAEHWRTATALQADPGQRHRYGAARAKALDAAGRRGQAVDVLLAAAHDAEVSGAAPEIILQYQCFAMQNAVTTGAKDVGDRLLRTLLLPLGLTPPNSRKASLVNLLWQRSRLALQRKHQGPGRPQQPLETASLETAWAAAVSLTFHDFVQAATYSAWFLRRAYTLGDRAAIGRGLAFEATYHAILGGRSREQKSAQCLNKALALQGDQAPAMARGWMLLGQTASAFFTMQYARTVELGWQAIEVFERQCERSQFERGTTIAFTAASLAHLGEITELQRVVRQETVTAEENGLLLPATGMRMGQCVFAWLAADDVTRWRLQAEAQMAWWWARNPDPVVSYYVFAMANAELYQGRPDQARQLLERHSDDLKRSGFQHIEAMNNEFNDLRARVLLSLAQQAPPADRKRLQSQVIDIASNMSRCTLAAAQARAQALRAGASCLLADHPKRIAAIRQAYAALKDTDLRMATHVAAWVLGQQSSQDEAGEPALVANAWMNKHGIVRPDRLAAVLLPGCAGPVTAVLASQHLGITS